MFLPVLLTVIATLCAADVAYGTHPAWAQYRHGIDFILLSRRLQWPMVAITIVLCVAIIGLIVGGRRRAWYLIGLAPVLALFAHHFAPNREPLAINDSPTFVAAAGADFVHDTDYVVGLMFGDTPYAYPFAALFTDPVVIHAEHDRRLMLVWSAYANRALAVSIEHDLRGRDLEIVSSPANSLVIYNSRLGQFINGVTGMTVTAQRPTGVTGFIPTTKIPWRIWREAHPTTRVLRPKPHPGTTAPTQPILPAYPMPAPTDLEHPADLRVALIGTTRPAAVEEDAVGTNPVNFSVDDVPMFVVKISPGGPLRAFDRRLPDDLRPRFDRAAPNKAPGVVFVDADTNSGWSASGVWVDGLKELKGKKLAAVPVESGLYWGVMKFWFPDLQLQATPKP